MSAYAGTVIALCRKCRRAIFSWETPSMIPGLPGDVCWSHYVLPPRRTEHPAMPLPGVQDRILRCTACRQPQKPEGAGWACSNEHCPARMD